MPRTSSGSTRSAIPPTWSPATAPMIGATHGSALSRSTSSARPTAARRWPACGAIRAKPSKPTTEADGAHDLEPARFRGQDSAPPLVRRCLASWPHLTLAGTCRVLDRASFEQFVELPDLTGKRLSPASLSDLLRAHLLRTVRRDLGRRHALLQSPAGGLARAGLRPGLLRLRPPRPRPRARQLVSGRRARQPADRGLAERGAPLLGAAARDRRLLLVSPSVRRAVPARPGVRPCLAAGAQVERTWAPRHAGARADLIGRAAMTRGSTGHRPCSSSRTTSGRAPTGRAP